MKKTKKSQPLKHNQSLRANLIISVILGFSLLGGLSVWHSFATTMTPYKYSLQKCERLADQSFVASSCPNRSAESLVYRYYKLILGRPPESSGYKFWVKELSTDSKQTPELVANRMLLTNEGKKSKAYKLTDKDFASSLYLATQGVKPSTADLDGLVKQLNNKKSNRPKVISQMATSTKADSFMQAGFNQYMGSIGEIYKFKKVANIVNPNRPQLIRDGGIGAKVGNSYLWTFGDTLFNPASVDGSNGRSNTAGWASLGKPFAVSDSLDANRAPKQFIDLSKADQNYNLKTKKGDDRYAIWPIHVLSRPSHKDALIFYERLKVNPGGGGLNYDMLNTGVARVKEGSSKATIINPSLFAKPNFFAGRGFVESGYVYLYQCKPNIYKLDNCRIGRAPVSQAATASGYTFWNGKSWQSNIKDATYSLPGHSSGSALGKLPNGKYVVFYSDPFTNKVFMVTSSSLTSGWSKPSKIYEAKDKIYAVTYHPDLTTNKNGISTIYLSFYEPDVGLQAISARVRN